jgi:hypothetical protein
MANNKIIPAGECTIQSADMDAHVLTIRNIAAKTGLFAPSSRADAKQASGRTELVFKHYGNQYFLTEIRLRGGNETYKLSPSRAETELRAQNAPASQQTLLASLQ